MAIFELITPPHIIFGKGSIEKLGLECVKFGKKALLVTGSSAMRKLKILDQVTEDLERSGIKPFLFDEIKGEPDLEIVEEGRNLAKRHEVEMVIGLGGGSALDAAKAIAGLFHEEGKCEEYQKERKIKKRGISFIAIPTTSGTGTEATYNAVILNKKERVKKSLRDFSLMAKLAIVDPLLSRSVPQKVKTYTGIDALVHAIEGYISKEANSFTDPLALSAISLIQANIREMVYSENNLFAYEQMSLGALKAGMVIANAKLGAIHGIAASLGAFLEIPHGLACAVLLPKILKFNQDVCNLKFYHLLQALGEQTKDLSLTEAFTNCFTFIEKLLLDLKIPFYLERSHVTQDDILSIANNCSASINFNPKELKREDIINIINSVLVKS